MAYQKTFAIICDNDLIFISSRDILERLIELQSYENQFLPNALRQFFTKLDAPEDRNEYLSVLIENFSKRFHECNKNLGLSTGLYISL
jgi:hypothetical protein